MNENKVVIDVEANTKSFERQIEQVKTDLESIDAILKNKKKLNLSEEEIERYALEAEKLTNKLVQLKEQQDKIAKKDLKDIQKQIGNIINGIKKTTKKVGKWALAVFGIRSAFMFVRNSINAITQQDEQLKANIDYMKNAIAYTIEPIVRKIVDWAYQILQYVRYIIKSWFNYDIFGNANKNLKATNKSAKELKRTLASFDEVNILSSGSSGTGSVAPNIDLQTDIQPPKWVQRIADNKKLIETFGIAIGAAFAYSKIKGILSNIAMLFGASGGMGLIGLAEILAVIGTAYIATIAVKGVADAIDQANEVKDAWDNTKNAMDNVGEKQKELINQITNDFENLPEENVEQFFGYLDSSIQLANNQIEGLSKQKDNLWWSPSKQKEIQKQIDEYQQRLNNLTDTKYKLLIETKVDSTQLGEFMTQVSKSSILNLPKTLLSVGNKLKSLTGLAKGGISYPRLAKGAIGNLPGRGIPTTLGNGRWAEAGMEGYLPLTDAQVMSMLGAEIGKNVTVNATIPVYAYNRQVDRQFRKIQGQDNFAGNR